MGTSRTVWLVIGNSVGFLHSLEELEEGVEARRASMEFYSIKSAVVTIGEVVAAGHITQEHATQYIRAIIEDGSFPAEADCEDEEYGISDFTILRLMESRWSDEQIRLHLLHVGMNADSIDEVFRVAREGIEEGKLQQHAIDWENAELLPNEDEDTQDQGDESQSDAGAPLWGLSLLQQYSSES